MTFVEAEKKRKTQFEVKVMQVVKALRKELDITQEQLAFLVGVDHSFIGQIESLESQSKYKLDHLNRLAFKLDISPAVLMPASAVMETDREDEIEEVFERPKRKVKIRINLAANHSSFFVAPSYLPPFWPLSMSFLNSVLLFDYRCRNIVRPAMQNKTVNFQALASPLPQSLSLSHLLSTTHM